MNMQSQIDKLELQFGVRILPAKIIGGRRWSFIGNTPGSIPIGQTKRIRINEHSGVIVYNWHTLDDSLRSALEMNIIKLKLSYEKCV